MYADLESSLFLHTSLQAFTLILHQFIYYFTDRRLLNSAIFCYAKSPKANGL